MDEDYCEPWSFTPWLVSPGAIFQPQRKQILVVLLFNLLAHPPWLAPQIYPETRTPYLQ